MTVMSGVAFIAVHSGLCTTQGSTQPNGSAGLPSAVMLPDLNNFLVRHGPIAFDVLSYTYFVFEPFCILLYRFSQCLLAQQRAVSWALVLTIRRASRLPQLGAHYKQQLGLSF